MYTYLQICIRTSISIWTQNMNSWSDVSNKTRKNKKCALDKVPSAPVTTRQRPSTEMKKDKSKICMFSNASHTENATIVR